MNSELLYQLALTLVPNVGDVHAKVLVQHFGSAKAIFSAKKADLEKIEGIGAVTANGIKKFNEFDIAEREIAFIEKYKIKPLFLNDAGYPQRFASLLRFAHTAFLQRHCRFKCFKNCMYCRYKKQYRLRQGIYRKTGGRFICTKHFNCQRVGLWH
jgi:NAD-dependent DNA ligase